MSAVWRFARPASARRCLDVGSALALLAETVNSRPSSSLLPASLPCSERPERWPDRTAGHGRWYPGLIQAGPLSCLDPGLGVTPEEPASPMQGVTAPARLNTRRSPLTIPAVPSFQPVFLQRTLAPGTGFARFAPFHISVDVVDPWFAGILPPRDLDILGPGP